VNQRLPETSDPLLRTLDDLAAFGEKRVGTPAGLRAGEYVRARMLAAGLRDVRFEPFHFPRHEVVCSSFELSVAGMVRKVGWDVFEGAGGGHVRGPIVHVGWAEDLQKLAQRGVSGQIALLDRNPLFHRSTQYLNLAAAGAAAMLSVSTAPANLRQVGSVRRAWESAGPIPAISIGAADGLILKAALDSNQPVLADLQVEIAESRGCGQNVVGVIEGHELHQIVIGAHYDTWFAGSTDNGGGVAALLQLAERRARRPPPRYTLVFVAWDGEEVALYGGYDFLRRHRILEAAPILAVIDLETPSAHGAQAYGLARSGHEPLETAINAVGLNDLFAMNVPMDLVPELFGGVIPTDIQGMYRAGTPSVSTAVDSPYYHTVEDTPDKVDLPRLHQTIDGFDRAIDLLLSSPPERFARRDPALWQARVRARAGDQMLLVDVAVEDGFGRAQANAFVEAVLFHDHFFETATRNVRTGADGRATLRFPAAAFLGRRHPRFLHVTAGATYPLVETVIALDGLDVD
jgi:hypothetical protein